MTTQAKDITYKGPIPEGPHDTLAHSLNIAFGGKWHPTPTDRDGIRVTNDNGVAVIAVDNLTAFRAVYGPKARFPGHGPTPLAAYNDMVARMKAAIEEAEQTLIDMRAELEAMQNIK